MPGKIIINHKIWCGKNIKHSYMFDNT